MCTCTNAPEHSEVNVSPFWLNFTLRLQIGEHFKNISLSKLYDSNRIYHLSQQLVLKSNEHKLYLKICLKYDIQKTLSDTLSLHPALLCHHPHIICLLIIVLPIRIHN